MEDVSKVKPKYSEVLKDFRDKTRWPQARVAKAIGVRQATISDWENGKSSAKDFIAGIRFALLALNSGFTKDDLLFDLIEEQLKESKNP